MRVALVTDYWLPTLGGVQTAVKAQSELLREAGHEVTVFHPRGRRDAAVGDAVGLPASRVFRPDGYPFAWPPRRVAAVLIDEFRRRRIDVVHTHSEMFAALGGIEAAQAVGIPRVHTMHGRIDVYTRHVLPLPALTMPLLAGMHASRVPHRGVRVTGGTPYTRTPAARAMWRVMVAQADAVDEVIVPSDHFRRKLAAQGVTTPMAVVPNGIEPTVRARIRRSAPRSDPRAPLRLVWVGRLSPEKRPVVFVDAVAALGDTVRADVLGDGVSRRRVARAAAALPGTLRLHGAVPQDRVLEVLADVDLAVSTSFDFDNQPMALLEAVAAGVPVLVADRDIAETLPPGTTIVAPTPDAAGIARAVRELQADPGALVAARAAAARTADAPPPSIDALVAVYERVLGR